MNQWWKGSFPQWLVTGLLGVCVWFVVNFVNTRERQLEMLVRTQSEVQWKIATIDQRLPVLENNVTKLTEMQKQLADSQVSLLRVTDRLTFVLEQMQRKAP